MDLMLCMFVAEYGYMMKITEKSDVYSYGVVMLEILTGKQPIDPTIPDGLHIVDFVRQRRGNIEVLDQCLQGKPDSENEEIMQTLGVALLCVNHSPDDRPTMKDVAAMLKEIRQDREDGAKIDMILKESASSEEQMINNGANEGPSSTPRQCLYSKSNNSSFSASSLLDSSCSNSKVFLK